MRICVWARELVFLHRQCGATWMPWAQSIWLILGIHCTELCFESTCFSSLTVKVVWDGHHRCAYLHWSDESSSSDQTQWFYDDWWVGSSVDTTGHHPGLNDVALWEERPRTAPRQNLSQHPNLCSRHEGGGGGLSFQQPLSHATCTPASIYTQASTGRPTAHQHGLGADSSSSRWITRLDKI